MCLVKLEFMICNESCLNVERFRNSNPAFEPMNMLFFTEMLVMLLLTVIPL